MQSRNRYPEDTNERYPQRQGISESELQKLIDSRIAKAVKVPAVKKEQPDLQNIIDMAVKRQLDSTPYRTYSPVEANMGYHPIAQDQEMVETRRASTFPNISPEQRLQKTTGTGLNFEIHKIDFIWVLLFIFVIICILKGITQ